jgi:hypothetical protein
MENENLPTTNQDEARPINWDIQSHIRLMTIREVAAMSLGVSPDKESIENAKTHKDFLSAYRYRQRLLTSKFNETSGVGLVTYFPNHARNKGVDGGRNRIVDVVSCITVMQESDIEELPPEFIALKNALLKIPLPDTPITIEKSLDKLADGLVISSAKQGTAKRDQTIAVQTKKEDKYPILIYGLAKAAYEFSFDLPAGQQDKIIDSIISDLIKAGVVGYGLGSTAFKSILERGWQAMKDKGLKP